MKILKPPFFRIDSPKGGKENLIRFPVSRQVESYADRLKAPREEHKTIPAFVFGFMLGAVLTAAVQFMIGGGR